MISTLPERTTRPRRHGRPPLISPEAERRCWDRYRESRDNSARNELIQLYLPVVQIIAAKVARRLPPGAIVTRDDLVSTGIFGLTGAIDRFEPERGLRFATFVQPRIRGAMIDSLRELDHVPRLERQRERQGLRQVHGLRQLGDLAAAGLVGRRHASSAELNDFWREHLKGIDQRSRLVMLMHFREEMRMKDVAQALGISESRVSQMVAGIVAMIRSRHDVQPDPIQAEPPCKAKRPRTIAMSDHRPTQKEPVSDEELIDLLERITLEQIDEQISRCETRRKAWESLRELAVPRSSNPVR